MSFITVGDFAIKIASDTHSYTYSEPLIYIFKQKPTSKQLNQLPQNAYVLIKNPALSAWRVDSRQRLSFINWPEEKIRQIIFKKEEKHNKKLSTDLFEIDFYLMHQLKENPIRDLSGINGNNRFAYLLCNDVLHLIDRKNKLLVKQKLDQNALEDIIATLGIPKLDDDIMVMHGTITAEKEKVITHYVDLYARLKDECLPVNDRVDEAVKNEMIESINEIPGHNQGVYKIYKAVVNTQMYAANLGNPINGNFITPSEYSRMTIAESLTDFYKNSLTNKDWVSDQLKKQMNKTILNPDWIADKSISLLNFFHVLHFIAPDPTKHRAIAEYVNRLKVYNDSIITPRVGFVYTPTQDIDVVHISAQAHHVPNIKLAAGHITTSAAVWIVSDLDFNDIDKNEKIAKNSPNTFICFSEKDADNVLKAIKENRNNNLALLAFAAHSFEKNGFYLDDHPLLAKNSALTIAKEYRDLFANYSKVFDLLIKRQNNYVDELHEFANPEGLMNRGGPMKYRLRARNIWQDYDDSVSFPHFDKIEVIYNKLSIIISELDQAIQQRDTISLQKVNRIIEQMADELKSYVREHPYLGAENSVPHLLLTYMNDLNHFVPNYVLKQKNVLENLEQANQIRDQILARCSEVTEEPLRNYFKKLQSSLKNIVGYYTANQLQKSEIKLALMKLFANLDTNGFFVNRADKISFAVSINDIDRYVRDTVFNKKSLEEIITEIKYAPTKPEATHHFNAIGLFAHHKLSAEKAREPTSSQSSKFTPQGRKDE